VPCALEEFYRILVNEIGKLHISLVISANSLLSSDYRRNRYEKMDIPMLFVGYVTTGSCYEKSNELYHFVEFCHTNSKA
jgi:hypothetical protein